MGFRWRNVVFAAACVTVLVACGAWITNRQHSPPDPSRRFDAHQIPLDYADENVRDIVESLSTEYRMFIDVVPLLNGCDASKEVYRIKTLPGLGGPPFQVTDLTISGNTARAIRREFQVDEDPNQKVAWREVSNKLVSFHAADQIRDAAIDLLMAKPLVSDGLPPPDTGEWTIEMCWYGRYHLFQRHFLDLPRDNEFDTFATRLTQLGRTE
jgi:hypothetical protein